MMRVVVVGNGMVGSRLVQLLAPHTGRSLRVALLGEESGPAYNRVRLAEVIGGTAHPDVIRFSPPSGFGVHWYDDTAAVTLDRRLQVVIDQHGRRHPYDLLVLATGAEARLPAPLSTALAGGGCRVLRTLADAETLLSEARVAERAVVLGGGVLGIEAAVALRSCGVPTTIVHPLTTLMERQLDQRASDALTHRLQALDIGHVLGVGLRRPVLDVAGHLHAVELDDGRELPADLLLVSVGTIPRSDLATAAGLDVERGIVVDERLRSVADPAIAAIGDCAQPPGGASGLVAQGWRQAEQLAAELIASLSEDGTPAGSCVPTVVRAKGDGLDVVVCGSMAGPGRRITLDDADSGRYLSLRVEQGRLAGAICVGAGPASADVIGAFRSPTPLPHDPAHLMLGLTHRSDPAPTATPGEVVCHCNGVTDLEVREAVLGGATDVEAVGRCTRAGTGCTGCTGHVQRLIEEAAARADAVALP